MLDNIFVPFLLPAEDVLDNGRTKPGPSVDPVQRGQKVAVSSLPVGLTFLVCQNKADSHGGLPACEGPRAKQKTNDGDPIEEQNSCFALFEKQTSFSADDLANPHFEVSRIPDFLIRNPRQTRHKNVKCRSPGVFGPLEGYLFTPSSTIKALPWP
ncbi:hypothetical protein DL95DRAFT_461889 [Leptodontidium sp. 2 PMI_412]|nr:hypothetical protein DL95DRAFT_461889 [Leptodontidium sp. 2 PMI_412]